MVRALRVMTVQRGIDPRRYALLAFGGAGPLHAAAIAEELGMTTILVPRASGVLARSGWPPRTAAPTCSARSCGRRRRRASTRCADEVARGAAAASLELEVRLGRCATAASRSS